MHNKQRKTNSQGGNVQPGKLKLELGMMMSWMRPRNILVASLVDIYLLFLVATGLVAACCGEFEKNAVGIKNPYVRCPVGNVLSSHIYCLSQKSVNSFFFLLIR